MKRIFTLAILFHWMMFFALHAFGAVAGTVGFTTFNLFSLFDGNGPMRAMPMISAGMGVVALLAAVLFAWALLAAWSQPVEGDTSELDLEKAAFASSALVFSILSLIAIAKADPIMLSSSTIYFAALVVSWGAASVEWELLSIRAMKLKESEAARHARMMAGEAVWNMNLTRISGRKGTI